MKPVDPAELRAALVSMAEQKARHAEQMKGDPNEISHAEGVADGWEEAIAYLDALSHRRAASRASAIWFGSTDRQSRDLSGLHLVANAAGHWHVTDRGCAVAKGSACSLADAREAAEHEARRYLGAVAS